MRRFFPLSRAIRVTALLFLLGSEAAMAEDAAPPEYPKFGLLRERDLTPFGFLRLDMRPAHAVWAPPGNWAVEVLLGYQNTWAMSPNVEQYLKSLPGRRRLGPADLAAIRALPGEAYLVDLELGLVDVALHKRLTEHWSVNATFAAVNYSGGFMDGLIEDFHKTFGFDSYGRPAGADRRAAGFSVDRPCRRRLGGDATALRRTPRGLPERGRGAHPRQRPDLERPDAGRAHLYRRL